MAEKKTRLSVDIPPYLTERLEKEVIRLGNQKGDIVRSALDDYFRKIDGHVEVFKR